jgi:hypothetical protein
LVVSFNHKQKIFYFILYKKIFKMNKLFRLIFFFLIKKICFNSENFNGLHLSNHGFSASVSQNGKFFSKIFINPSKLGEYIEEIGNGFFSIKSKNNVFIEDYNLKKKVQSKIWPFFETEIIDEKIENDLKIKVLAFSPFTTNQQNIFLNFLQIGIIEIEIENLKKINYVLQVKYNFENLKINSNYYNIEKNDIQLDKYFLGVVGDDNINTKFEKIGKNNLQSLTDIKILKEKINYKFQIIIGAFEKNGYYYKHLQSITDILQFVKSNITTLKENLEQFIEKIPLLEDKKLNEYLRWYIQPAVTLTKGISNGSVITMGYSELNQRDSFWS